jgi:pilus assembly protein CpaE
LIADDKLHVYRSIVISPDLEIGKKLTAALEASGHVEITRALDHYPTGVELIRTVRALAADILFIDFGSLKDGLEIVHILEVEGSPLQIVGFDKKLDPAVMRETMRAGVREFLAEPFEARTLIETLASIKGHLDKRPAVYQATNQIFTFLPSKAGVGTSTIAVNVSAALSRRANSHVLLADFDLSSGMLRFMLKLTNEFSVPDALQRSADVDENLWPQLVTTIQGMDVLHAGRLNPNYRVDAAQIASLMAFMRRSYHVLCFDLSGNMEKYSIELMQESKRILLVCTGEIPSLHLAREKMLFLKELGLSGRIAVILNRVQKHPLFSKVQVEDLLGVPVVRVFANDYQAVTRAVENGKLLETDSELGKSFTEFAAQLVDQPGVKIEPGKRRFLEFLRPAATAGATRASRPHQKPSAIVDPP